MRRTAVFGHRDRACVRGGHGAARRGTVGRSVAHGDARTSHALMTRARASCVRDARTRHARFEVACVRDEDEDEDEDED